MPQKCSNFGHSNANENLAMPLTQQMKNKKRFVYFRLFNSNVMRPVPLESSKLSKSCNIYRNKSDFAVKIRKKCLCFFSIWIYGFNSQANFAVDLNRFSYMHKVDNLNYALNRTRSFHIIGWNGRFQEERSETNYHWIFSHFQK